MVTSVKKHPGGRPSSYNPEICESVVKMMAEGMSKTVVASKLDIAYSTLWEWTEKYPEFSNAIKRGEKLSEAWWEEQARSSLRDKEFNATLWYMNMKNRFGWRDKQEHQHSGGVELKHVDRLAHLK